MQILTFDELMIQSLDQRRARRIKFDPNATIIKGTNSSGKSIVLSGLFRALGTNPSRQDAFWNGVYCAVRFRVNKRRFCALAFKGENIIFDEFGHVVASSLENENSLTKFWVKTLGLERLLPLGRDGAQKWSLPAGAPFLPFYMDQESSWRGAEPLAGFRGLGAFTALGARYSIIETMAGARSYEHQRTQEGYNRTLKDVERLKGMERALEHIEADMVKRYDSRFYVDPEPFEHEIKELVAQCDVFRQRDEEFKDRYAQLMIERADAFAEMKVAERGAVEARKDHEYALSIAKTGQITCWTCGAEYENSMVRRFNLAEDEDTCTDLAASARVRLQGTERKIKELMAEQRRNSDELARVEALRNQRKGHIELSDFVNAAGLASVKEAIGKQVADCRSQLASTEQNLDATRKQIARENKARGSRRAIVIQRFVEAWSELLVSVGLSGDSLQQQQIHGLEFVGDKLGHGSARPLVLLTYHLAIIKVIESFPGGIVVPFVVDSPRQQDMGGKRWLKALVTLRDRRPTGQQLILGTRRVPEGIFLPTQIVDLGDEERQLLNSEDYASVATELRPMLRELPQLPLPWEQDAVDSVTLEEEEEEEDAPDTGDADDVT